MLIFIQDITYTLYTNNFNHTSLIVCNLIYLMWIFSNIVINLLELGCCIVGIGTTNPPEVCAVGIVSVHNFVSPHHT